MSQYLGISPEAWSLIFDGLQAVSISAGIAFGAYQLRNIQRQRSAASFDKMFKEWRESLPAQHQVLADMPMQDGTLEERAVGLALEISKIRSSGDENEWRKLKETLEVAREVVHCLNDLGVIVEQKIVDQQHFFQQFHYRISELVYLLEPYVLLVSTARRGRWGLRLIRLGIGAQRYHQTSRIDSDFPLSVRDHIIVRPLHSSRYSVAMRIKIRRSYIPTRYETAKDMIFLIEETEKLLDATGDPNLSLATLKSLLNV